MIVSKYNASGPIWICTEQNQEINNSRHASRLTCTLTLIQSLRSKHMSTLILSFLSNVECLFSTVECRMDSVVASIKKSGGGGNNSDSSDAVCEESSVTVND
jgi:hypothetical protein